MNENREKEQVLPPTVRSLKGALKKGALGEDDYRKYLEEKFSDTGIPKHIEQALASDTGKQLLVIRASSCS